jgi:hypothetical protein
VKTEVERVRREHALHTALDPARLAQGLALGTMTVAARVVGDGCVPARVAHVDVSAQRGRPAACDGAQDGMLIGREGVRAHKGLPVEADDVRDLESRPILRAHPGRRVRMRGQSASADHRLLGCPQDIDGTLGLGQDAAGQVGVAHGRANRAMPEQHLDHADVGAELEKVGRVNECLNVCGVTRLVRPVFFAAT